MFENENEAVNSDALEPSSEAQESPQQQEAAPAPQEAKQPDAEKLPFHEHPRFRELVEEKNQYAEQLKQMRQQMSQFESQFKQSQTQPSVDKRSAMLERLKGIDPEFAEFVSELAPQNELKELREWKSQQESARAQEEARTQISHLHEQHKVPAELRARYEDAITAAALKDPSLTARDLPKVYAKINQEFSSYLESVKRSERESYVSAKKADTNLPSSQPKGKPVQGGQKPAFSSDPAKARQELISRVLKQSKASSDV